jgi:hypothetical protein
MKAPTNNPQRQAHSAPPQKVMHNEGLADKVSRWKHRWLKRVMSDRKLSTLHKCFAYIVTDRLNCVTLDAWPGQHLIARELGAKSIKTARRAAIGLEKHGYLGVTQNARGSCRYAPVFLEEDKIGGGTGQNCQSAPDKIVDQSSLDILPNLSSPTETRQNGNSYSTSSRSNYDRRKRGAYECELAKWLGNDGFDILQRLSEFNDLTIEQLCRAYADGELGPRELSATILAAEQLPKKRRPN